MCFSSAFFKLPRKVKFLVLVGFCVMILTWIATFGNVTNAIRDRPRLVELVRSQKVVTEGLRSAEELEWGNRHPSLAPVATLQSCPALSPHLRGPLALFFKPSLTLAEVERENARVVEGQYEPPDCQARQSVAVLIPHRSREKHLRYLLQHLHPFLQRQQLHYAIYVIHQVQHDPRQTTTSEECIQTVQQFISPPCNVQACEKVESVRNFFFFIQT
ncbi:beta-1,4-galactosyltransferase 4-like [Polyodon spathula]|uniref:beta-1,4-galactosyltransferase 4-like n=1 Tax=Polyodon spathula TaxID=7913 RepID=UPI001B7E8DCB|nr:beta-1,4-galactosyltransferase 4-like [Polyodon spathula]XP_041088621.1 beta-1,4-galactosyltransferase 4-like [Polyodon spathula]